MNGRWFEFKRQLVLNPYEFCVFWTLMKLVRSNPEAWVEVQALRAKFQSRSPEMEADLATLAAMRLVVLDKEADRVSLNPEEVQILDR